MKNSSYITYASSDLLRFPSALVTALDSDSKLAKISWLPFLRSSTSFLNSVIDCPMEYPSKNDILMIRSKNKNAKLNLPVLSRN